MAWSYSFILLCHAPAVHTETARWWCTTCEQARLTVFTFARKRADNGYRVVESAVCDRGHAFDPYA